MRTAPSLTGPVVPGRDAIALDGCELWRRDAGGIPVEIVSADARPRRFPFRLARTLGVCVKQGRSHGAVADGRPLVIPADVVIVRAPGCTWSSETAEAAFVSADLDVSGVVEAGGWAPMTCWRYDELPGVLDAIRAIRDAPAPLARSEAAASILLALSRRGFVRIDADRDAPRTAPSRAAEFLRANALRNVTLDELARAAGANRFVLLRRFRETFGLTPHAYLVQLRVDAARRLLAGGLAAGEAAVQAGFADQSHLTRVFRRTMGITPGQYASRLRG